MNIYVSHSNNFNYKQDLYEPVRKAFKNSTHEVTLPHQKSNEPFSTKKYFERCDLVIAEVSYPSTGQGIELGWANSLNIPIICVHKKDAVVSKSLNKISHIFINYIDPIELTRKLDSHVIKK